MRTGLAKKLDFPRIHYNLWIPAFLIGLTALAAQWSAFGVAFIELEDYRTMFASSQGRNWQSWTQLFSPDYFEVFASGFYRPLRTLFYWAGWQLFGAHILAYHLFKLFSISAIAFMVYLLALDLSLGKTTASTAAILFASHPWHSQSMLRLSHVDDIFMTFFCLSAFWAYLQLRKENMNKISFRTLLIVSYVLALAAKETAIALPGLIVMCDILFRPSDLKKCPPWKDYSALLGITGIYLFGILFWIGSGQPYYKVGFLGAIPFWESFMRLFSHILTLSEHWLGSAQHGRLLQTVFFWGAAMVCCISLRDRRNFVLFCAGWIVFSLLPAINIAPFPKVAEYMTFQAHSTRFFILPGVAFCWLAADLLKKCAFLPLGRIWAPVLAAYLIFLNINASHAAINGYDVPFLEGIRSRQFAHRDDIFSEPSFVAALVSLPLISKKDPQIYSDIKKAVSRSLPGHQGPTILDFFTDISIYERPTENLHVLEVLSIVGFKRFHIRLASLSMARKALQQSCEHLLQENWNKAATEFKRALELNPAYVRSFWPHKFSRTNLQLKALCDRQPSSDVTSWYAKQIHQSYELKDQGVQLFMSADIPGALSKFQRALDHNPDNVPALLSLGAALVSLDRLGEALECYDRILRLKLDESDVHADTLAARANVWRRLGSLENAKKDIRAALQVATQSWNWRGSWEQFLRDNPAP